MDTKVHVWPSAVHPVYGFEINLDLQDPKSFAPPFLEKVLRDSIKKGATRVKFWRSRGRILSVPLRPDGRDDAYQSRSESENDLAREFKILAESGGKFHEVANLPIIAWTPMVNRVKVMGRMIDSGPHATTEGSFRIDSEETGDTVFRVTTNPNPYKDTEVIVELVR